MKIEDGLFEGMTPVKLKGKCADGAEYSYQAFSVSEVLGSVTADSLVEFVSGDGRDTLPVKKSSRGMYTLRRMERHTVS